MAHEEQSSRGPGRRGHRQELRDVYPVYSLRRLLLPVEKTCSLDSADVGETISQSKVAKIILVRPCHLSDYCRISVILILSFQAIANIEVFQPEFE
jgi:hypothetical protein